MHAVSGDMVIPAYLRANYFLAAESPSVRPSFSSGADSYGFYHTTTTVNDEPDGAPATNQDHKIGDYPHRRIQRESKKSPPDFF